MRDESASDSVSNTLPAHAPTLNERSNSEGSLFPIPSTFDLHLGTSTQPSFFFHTPYAEQKNLEPTFAGCWT